MRTRPFAVCLMLLALAAPLSANTITVHPASQLAGAAFPLPVPQYLASIITDAAKAYGVDPNLVAAMAFRESASKPAAVSQRGAQGIMQLMPNTARALGVKDAFDPRDNVFGATKYLAQLLHRFNGNIDMTLAAYNAGPELVQQVGPAPNQEAIEYVAAVKDFYLTALRAL